MVPRRIIIILLACVFLPFLFVSLSRLGSSDTTKVPIHKAPKEHPAPPNKHKQEWSDIEFKKNQGGSNDKNANKQSGYPAPARSKNIPTDSVAAQVWNETLGFGAILLISLKTRTDRQDAVSLIASQAGLRVTHVIDAVRGEDIHQKAYPYGKARSELPLPYLGSWRSHMDAFKYIIDNRIETALLIEDDVDWDIYVKEQMTALSVALRSNPLRKPLTADESKRAPYGLDWDVMHLGTSKNLMAPPPLNSLYHRYKDEYTTPRAMTKRNSPCGDRDFFCWNDIIKMTGMEDNERVVFPSYQPVGLVSLAVSYRGAQKMLYDLSWKGLDMSMDWGVRDGCTRGFLKGWSVTPPIMSSWRVRGAGDSDLRNNGKGDIGVGNGNMKGEGIGLAWSSRKALQQEFEGFDYWKDGTYGWFGSAPKPVADDSYWRQPPANPVLADHQKNKANRNMDGEEEKSSPVKAEEKPAIVGDKKEEPFQLLTDKQEPSREIKQEQPQSQPERPREEAPPVVQQEKPKDPKDGRPVAEDDAFAKRDLVW
ncbi:hypothetical protein ABW20_dc0103961 [Dactylellina cionopaga]|nr:hypothetical protein ABW20_dc0103961 [Dactylellina cionopaga]